MKYISIDTETTGLNPKTCQILSFAAVLEDTSKLGVPVEELPSMHIILNLEFIKGEPFALNMNKDLIEIIKEGKDDRLIPEFNLVTAFNEFLMKNDIDLKKIKVAGKNFASFDKLFIDNVALDTPNFSHRVLDVGPLFLDFKNDNWIPGLDECKKRAGISGAVTHDALEDARDVIRVLRTKY